MKSTGGKSSGPFLLFLINDLHISRISSSVKRSGGCENVHDSIYTEAKNFENNSAFNGSVSAVSFLYFSILGKLDL